MQRVRAGDAKPNRARHWPAQREDAHGNDQERRHRPRYHVLSFSRSASALRGASALARGAKRARLPSPHQGGRIQARASSSPVRGASGS